VASALEQVCSRSVATASLAVDGSPVAVSPAVEAALVRVAQGALGNIDRHAGTGARAVVSLSWGRDTVRLDVVDDGIGFDPDALAEDNPAFGLATMQARVLELGGEFAVESEPGHTAVSASFPLGAGAPGATVGS
jgi:signal transduction histidine kinase